MGRPKARIARATPSAARRGCIPAWHGDFPPGPPRECVVRCLESWCLRIERLLPPDCEDTMPYIVGAERPATLLDASCDRSALPPTSPPLVECAGTQPRSQPASGAT
ncbi:hypothetical protein MRX96_041574 [Rhipicephalus microplus]